MHDLAVEPDVERHRQGRPLDRHIPGHASAGFIHLLDTGADEMHGRMTGGIEESFVAQLAVQLRAVGVDAGHRHGNLDAAVRHVVFVEQELDLVLDETAAKI